MLAQPPETEVPVAHSTLPDALIASLEMRRDTYGKQVARCRRHCTEEAVHDLRVASRRLVATIRLITTAVPDERAEVLVSALRRRFRSFGPLRDIQVQVLKVGELRESFPVLELFYTLLLLKEQRLLRTTAGHVTKIDTSGIRRTLAGTSAKFRAAMDNPAVEQAARSAIIGTAAGTFARAASRLQSVRPRDSSTIHRLRVAFKKFRYAAEALQPVLPGITADRLRAMNGYQDRMGHVQDNQVLRVMLKRFTASTAKRNRAGMTEVHRALTGEHRRLVETFMSSRDELYSFWENFRNNGSAGTSLIRQ